jgi:ubiquinone/menaquinone biosynthesis C-methylase UbiE
MVMCVVYVSVAHVLSQCYAFNYLDLGTGNGDIACGVAKKIGLGKENFFAVDVKDNLSSYSAKECTFHCVKPNEKLPADIFENGLFDLVTVFMSLHHFHDDHIQQRIE